MALKKIFFVMPPPPPIQFPSYGTVLSSHKSILQCRRNQGGRLGGMYPSTFLEIAVVTLLENNAAQKNFLCHAPPPPPYNFLPTVLFCNQNLGNQNVSWTFGGRGFCPGRFFVTNKHRLLSSQNLQ